MRTKQFMVALLAGLILAGTVLADECPFTKSNKECVTLHAQVRELFLAGQEYGELIERIKELQKWVSDVCVNGLQAGQEHLPEAFMSLCKAAADKPIEGDRCETDFITSGWDLLAFGHGLKRFKTTVAFLALNEADPVKKVLFKKYLKEANKYYKLAKERKTAFFGEDDGCGGHDH